MNMEMDKLGEEHKTMCLEETQKNSQLYIKNGISNSVTGIPEVKEKNMDGS
jgi:hypothetical protein